MADQSWGTRRPHSADGSREGGWVRGRGGRRKGVCEAGREAGRSLFRRLRRRCRRPMTSHACLGRRHDTRLHAPPAAIFSADISPIHSFMPVHAQCVYRVP